MVGFVRLFRDTTIGMGPSWLIVGFLFGSAIAQHQSQTSPPISIGIVFDSSGSMGAKLHQSRQAVAAFFKTANPEDEFFLVEFNDRPTLVSSFTRSTQAIEDKLTLTQSKGKTALLDGIYMAEHEMKKARNARKALLIISDGG